MAITESRSAITIKGWILQASWQYNHGTVAMMMATANYQYEYFSTHKPQVATAHQVASHIKAW